MLKLEQIYRYNSAGDKNKVHEVFLQAYFKLQTEV